MTTSPSQHVFILAGMHRSGTSMAASILQAGGVNMGERLMGADRGNVRGHFENLDFFEFHRDLLKSHGYSAAGWVHDPLPPIPPDLASRARQLAADNAAHAGPAGWGFKDPRSTLFLDYWQNLLPAAHFVFIYRAPWEVADSVFRRGTDQDQFFREDPAAVIRVWAHYNRLSLDFIRRHPDQSLLVSNDAVVADPAAFVRLLNDRFHASLASPSARIVDREIMHTGVSASTRPQLIIQSFPDILPLLEELDARCTLRSESLSPDHLRALASSRDFKDSFRDWFEHYQLRRENEAAASTLQSDLAWYQEKVASLESALADHGRIAAEHHAALTHQHELLTDLNRRLASLNDELTQERRAHGPVRWEFLKARADLARLSAEAQALLSAFAASRPRGLLGAGKEGARAAATREQAIEVQLDPPDAASISPERVLLIMPGPFSPGACDIHLQVLPPSDGSPPPASATLRFSHFPGSPLWTEVKAAITLAPHDSLLGGTARIQLQGNPACCSLILPATLSPADVKTFTIARPR